MEGPSPFEGLRRSRGHICPYPEGTRQISSLNALKAPCGGVHHGGAFAFSETKSDTRRARSVHYQEASQCQR